MNVTIHTDDGDTVDITEAVRVLYDLVVGSMDWGSNFLTADDVLTVTAVGQKLGYIDFGGATAQVAAYLQWNTPARCPDYDGRPDGWTGEHYRTLGDDGQPKPPYLDGGEWVVEYKCGCHRRVGPNDQVTIRS